MQSDEDIGKVAQATPIVVAKALELFMISLVEESCNQARLRNAKRVTPAHLKQAVKAVEHFDFLEETVRKYPDPVGPASPQPGSAAASSSSSAAAAASASTAAATASASAGSSIANSSGGNEDDDDDNDQSTNSGDE